MILKVTGRIDGGRHQPLAPELERVLGPAWALESLAVCPWRRRCHVPLGVRSKRMAERPAVIAAAPRARRLDLQTPESDWSRLPRSLDGSRIPDATSTRF